MDAQRLQHFLDIAAKKKILVLGDLMLDEFVWGNVVRISPEAPVPVVEVERESSYPGGAANVARNLRQFCQEVHVLGSIGKDAAGEKLRCLMGEEGLETESLIYTEETPTIVKTRIIAQHQQVVRVDREKKSSRNARLLQSAMERSFLLLKTMDAILFEDYGKGFLCQELVDAILNKRKDQIVTSDPHPGNPLDWPGITVIKPNRTEAFAAAGVPLTPPVFPAERDLALLSVGERLLQRWHSQALLITLGEQGMMLFRSGHQPYHTPTRAQEVYDVSGAGDTAIALYTIGITSGATPQEAAELANHAAGIVIGKLGTATCSPEELQESFLKFSS
ncbi:MAG: D-glycero-beta-D-manno-heptose-7-phosphate kinase [Chthoniobacterales bacterium]|nr:D-glycero-beta-D-manno-heptose-7-phosphate kinase [Chthoniobacterales bacterium]